MVKYHLIENKLTERADDFTAQTQTVASYDKEMVIARIQQRGTLLTRTDILAVMNAEEETIVDIVTEGNTVVMPLYHLGFSITGTFDGPMDSFDPSRHKLNINVSKGTLLRDAQGNVKLEKTDAVTAALYVLEVKDTVSGAVNAALTPGGIMEVFGSNIKIEGSDPTCGLFFVNSEGAAVKVATIAQNKPATLIVLIPTLPAGGYRVKVVTQFNGNTQTKRPREYTFDHELTVS